MNEKEFFMFSDVKDFIELHGSDEFVKKFALLFPQHAYALTSSILHEHSKDYDKKKAALLARKV